MSLTFEDRLAAEVAAKVPCLACAAQDSLTPQQWSKFKAWRDQPKPNTPSHAAVSRVLEVTESAYKRHRMGGHVDPR